MFVVRIDISDKKPDFKVFSRKDGAYQRFIAAQKYVSTDEIESVAWFEVKGADDPRAAVEAVNAGAATLEGIYPRPPTEEEIDETMRILIGENWKDT